MTDKELLINRRSIRKYKDQIIDQETIMNIIELTKFAPSWCNYQIARYTVVQDQEKIKLLADTATRGFNYNTNTLQNAKNVMIISYKKGMSGRLKDLTDDNEITKWESFDAGIATLQFCLAAYTQNIGTCIMGVFDSNKIKSIITIPEDEEIAAIVTFGFIDEEPTTKRIDAKEIVKFN